MSLYLIFNVGYWHNGSSPMINHFQSIKVYCSKKGRESQRWKINIWLLFFTFVQNVLSNHSITSIMHVYECNIDMWSLAHIWLICKYWLLIVNVHSESGLTSLDYFRLREAINISMSLKKHNSFSFPDRHPPYTNQNN